AGLARAVEIAARDLIEDGAHLRTVRDRLSENVLSSVEGARLTGHPTERLPLRSARAFARAPGDGHDTEGGVEQPAFDRRKAHHHSRRRRRRGGDPGGRGGAQELTSGWLVGCSEAATFRLKPD